MIRHQMTGAGLHTLSFRGPEAQSRYLLTRRHSLQAVKTHAELPGSFLPDGHFDGSGEISPLYIARRKR